MARNETVICPFDPQHKVTASRLQYHIVKCRRKHADLAKLMKTCPFNARHRMPEVNLKHHVLKCPDREILINDQLNVKPAEELVDRPHNYVPSYQTESYQSSENWDLDDEEEDDFLTQRSASSTSFATALSHLSDVSFSIGHGVSTSVPNEGINASASSGVGIGRAVFRRRT